MIVLATALLAAAPPAARAQSGDERAARPSRPVDECGSPSARRARRQAAPPRLLGVRQDSAAASGTAAAAASGASQAPANAGAAAAAASAPGAGETMASSTSASGSAVSPNDNAGTTASSMSGAGQTMASSTSGSGGAGGPTDPRAAARNRAALRLGLGPAGDRARLGPAASVTVPTALGVDAGELFFGVAYQGRTRYTEEDDGAAVLGIGIGSRRILALEAAVTTYSTFRGAPLETGGLSVKLHRALPGQTSVAVGWENAVLWGDSDDDGSLYAVASRLVNLREDASAPFSTGVVTLGLGNGRFRLEEDDAEDRETVNVFGAVGVRVVAPLSLVADWSGQDLNAAASITPLRRLPLVITAGVVDITGSAGDGARLILSLGYGLAFPQPF